VQKQALAQLETLFEHSFGLYLSKEASQQQAFLTATPSQHQKIMTTLDLRFTASLFSFISEGTQRFPLTQVQMSPPPDRDLHALEPGLKAKLFSLKLDRKHASPSENSCCLKTNGYQSSVVFRRQRPHHSEQ
jgi:hypothetical protein